MTHREEIHIERMSIDPPRIIRFMDSCSFMSVVFGVVVYVSAFIGLSG